MRLSAQASRTEGASFNEVFKRYAPFVWRVLRHLGTPERELEDLSQEVFLVVHRKLHAFSGRSTLRTWVYGICLRTASDYRRRAHVRREEVTDAIPDTAMPPPQPEELEHKRARKLLDSILDELDADKRAVFVLYELEELTMAEVVEVLGCPQPTAFSRLYAARKHVEAAFRRAQTEGSTT